jgi:hypothetical protein
VAKRDIYDAYLAFCRANNYQTTNDATFGKIFKTIFPHVQVRRLVRRVKAKKWHYCDVTYSKGSSLFAAAAESESSATATADADEDDDDITQENAPRSRRTNPKKRKRNTKAARRSESDDDANYDEDDNEKEEERTSTAPSAKRNRRHSEDEEEGEEDGDYKYHDDEAGELRTPSKEEMQEVDGTPSAGVTSMWSDSDVDDSSSSSSSSSSSAASPAQCDAPRIERPEQPREEDKDLNHSSTDTPVCANPAERPLPAPTPSRRTGGDIELSASSALSVSSMLHSSSVFSVFGRLDGTTPLPLFGPAKTRLDDSSEPSSETPPSLTSSSAEMFFSYQPSSAAMADFIKTEKSERPRPISVAVTADREEVAPSPSPAPSPTLTQTPVHPFPAHHRPPHQQHQHTSFEPSPFEASRDLPIHSHAMTSLLHNHPTTYPTQTAPHYAYPPQPTHHHTSSSSTMASGNQSSAYAPSQHPLHQLPPQHQQHQYQHQPHQHHYNQQHQQHHQQHQHQFQHQPSSPHFSYPHSYTHPSAAQNHTAPTHPLGGPAQAVAPSPAPGGHAPGHHQPTDREMSPESVEIFISHLLTNKSSELMTLARQL